MSLDYSFACPLQNGVHARPASALEELARSFAADIVLVNQRTGRAANAKSILSIVGADIRFSDPCLLKASGSDEERAITTLGSFIRHTFPRHDGVLPAISVGNHELRLPRMLSHAGATFRRGTPVVTGIAEGRIVCASGFRIPAGLKTDGAADRDGEQEKVRNALEELIGWYGQRIAAMTLGVERELLAAHRSVARDEEFRRALSNAIQQCGRTAAGAISDAEAHFTSMLSASENPLLKERALDIRDVCSQLIQRIYGSAAGMAGISLSSDSVVVAESLTPCEFLALNREFLKGLVLVQAGTTSHTVILARSFGIPTLVGVENANGTLLHGEEAVVDADLGALVTNLTEAARRYYAMERRRLSGREELLRNFAEKPATTRDGSRLEIAANIATSEEATQALSAGAEGIGLFRTEMLFLDRDMAPDESEQFECYRRVLEAAAGRPVIIRTLDVGGDKPLRYLNLPVEQNPFLGYRALRIYPEFKSLFCTQVRAIIRASAHGTIKLMLPMVSTVEEVRWARRIIAEEQDRCAREGLSYDKEMAVGAMIEVPSAALAIEDLAHELDFFSIGSNDLLQYFTAADRANSRVTDLYDPLLPAFLRLLKQTVFAAHAQKKWIGLCGEMGGQRRLLPLLVGLGLDEISVSGPAIAGIKAALSRLEIPDCQQLLNTAVARSSAAEVGKLLDEFSVRHGASLLSPELILTATNASTKAEALKQAVDLLYVYGRTEQPRVVEDAVWQREMTYSTGFGYGFAIPHCKTAAVQSNSLVLLKLLEPVDWAAVDEKPVRLVILLAIREVEDSTAHMKVLSKLARQIMHEEFRARLEHEDDSAALCDFLKKKLLEPNATADGQG